MNWKPSILEDFSALFCKFYQLLLISCHLHKVVDIGVLLQCSDCVFKFCSLLLKVILQSGSHEPQMPLFSFDIEEKSESISRLINHCIDIGTFPSAWKTAKVTPIYKGQGSKDDKNNYRPISVLPLLSKIFEKHVHQALYSYMRNNNLLYTLQSGFRRSYLTETALICLTDQLLSDMEKDQVSGLVFVDYKKAFDLIDHDILLSKLEAYGITSKELMLLMSYLKGRRSSVTIGGVQSEYRPITHGVPQGSVLGPLLFIIFVNDLPNSVSQSTVDIYTDDTTLSTSAVVSDLPAIQQRLQDDINKIADWRSDNKMVLNASKSSRNWQATAKESSRHKV